MPASRLPLLDAMKGVGCMAIVLHHLAFYGPMSDVVHQAAPGTINFLFNYARLAVQMFFVLGGYLVAAQFSPDGTATSPSVGNQVWKRYRRLATPLVFAVSLAALITALVRPWFDHPSLSAAPSLMQFLAHALLLQDLIGVEALSAGVWYVAIDFQLFTGTVMLTALMSQAPVRWRWVYPVVIIVLCALSLWGVNRFDDYENDAPFFFGAYALGMLAYWMSRAAWSTWAWLALLVLGFVALWLEYRHPIAVALATAILLATSSSAGWLERFPGPRWLIWLGQRSYSIFLIHYGICIGFNAIWHYLFPQGVWINVIGMGLATLASVAAGVGLYNYVESRPNVFGRNLTTALLAAMVMAALAVESVSW
jgi:peptidoglycan/LPS O-acetylase OafA/YrhL